MTELATSRYQAVDLIRTSGLVPVGITVGRPKWPLGYTPVYMRELAPFGLIEIDDADEFAKHYLERLDRVGIDRIERRLAEISADHVGGGLVLLCYEPVGEPCHRHLFAGWYEQQTGQHVSELQESQPRLFSA